MKDIFLVNAMTYAFLLCISGCSLFLQKFTFLIPINLCFNYRINSILQLKQTSFTNWILNLNITKIKTKFTNEERSRIIKDLVSFVIKEPLIPINTTCKPQIQMSKKCTDYSFSIGEMRNPNEPKPKIAHLIQYGFETDVLEILISEIYDYVDKFFIVESEVTHFGNIKKPLIWPLLVNQNRFTPYHDKIVYINITSKMIDEYSSNYLGKDKNSIWKNEVAQEQLRFKLFLEWNKKNGDFFKDNDIIGFGDTDEIPSFHNLLLMKQCYMRGTTDIGIWFTHSQINKYWLSDFPVRGHRETLGDPTYWMLKDAIKKGNPSRNRGKSPFYLLGGLHLTRYGYLPSMILKDMTATESDGGSLLLKVRDFLDQKMSLYDVNKKIFFEDPIRNHPKNRDLDEYKLNKPPFIIPWIMQCNPLRYPSFLKDFPPDKRLE